MCLEIRKCKNQQAIFYGWCDLIMFQAEDYICFRVFTQLAINSMLMNVDFSFITTYRCGAFFRAEILTSSRVCVERDKVQNSIST